ncbi:MAG: tRNA glutamyl-Q(34) synthetase GluQRS [Bradyrhizobiaceae bacterium]|nr:tRNA glutamyl-Q(34) synthetase GluQRS [Bradyrhizobiaceae bacterium]
MPVFRFAPSPNGYLHLGHALSALLNADMAKAAGGRLLLRIEDIDPARCRPEFEAAIYEDLAWLGIEWEQPVRRQSEHFDEYRKALDRLEADGLVYPAFESRAEIARLIAAREAETGTPWPKDPDGAPLYPGNAKSLSADKRTRRRAAEPFALRLDMQAALVRIGRPLVWTETGGGESREAEAKPERWGDVILGRKEMPASYHLAVVLDDALQGVTHVVRGKDLYESTAVHRLLQELLGLPAPVYHHHRLVLDAEGKKLAKRDPATTLRDLRAAGWTPTDVRHTVGL